MAMSTTSSVAPAGGDRVVSARDLSTRGEAFVALAASASGRVIGLFLVVAVVVRAAAGPVRWADLVAVGVVVTLLGPVEWIVHRRLLHAAPDDRLAAVTGTRDSHLRHHADPDDLSWLLLRLPNAIVSCLAIVLPFVLLGVAGSRLEVAGPAEVRAWTATSIVAGLTALAHYEWVHLLVHSRYRPRSRYYARLDRHHRLHHFRNEGYWLGVTVDTGDRLFATLPASPTDVAPSATVRGDAVRRDD